MPVSDPQEQSSGRTPSGVSVRTVLIVDDDEQVLALLSRWMTQAGMHVVMCRTFQEAVQDLASVIPDVLVTDVRLEGANGLGLIARVKDRYPDVSPVVITGFDDPVLRREAGVLNAQFLVKPVRRQEFLAAVSKVIGT